MEEIKRPMYLNELIDRRENGSIKVITGVRRCGKSYLLFKMYREYLLADGVAPEGIVELALDDDENRALCDPDALAGFLRAKIDGSRMNYIFLDEVQFAIDDPCGEGGARLYGILNGLLRRENVDIYVTGSNSRFLSSDVLTEFRGRGDEIRVRPLNFAEFYSSVGGDVREAFLEYRLHGGLPPVLERKSARSKENYLKNLMNDLYLRDIIERWGLRGDAVIGDLVDILASQVGSLNNITKLVKTYASKGTRTTDKTLAAHIDRLLDAFLIEKVRRWDVKGKKYIHSLCKYYFTDVGLRNARLNFRQNEPTHLTENILYNELVARGYNVDVGIVESRSGAGDKHERVPLEIDFVCSRGDARYYVQSVFSIPDREKMSQEKRPLDKIRDSFRKIIVVGDETLPWHNDDGYLVINLIDFLLDPSSLDR